MVAKGWGRGVPDREQHEPTPKRKPPRSRARTTARINGRLRCRDAESAWPPPAVGRAILVVLSVGGVFLSLCLWLAGHGHLALRVLAGDVILATGLLLIM